MVLAATSMLARAAVRRTPLTQPWVMGVRPTLTSTSRRPVVSRSPPGRLLSRRYTMGKPVSYDRVLLASMGFLGAGAAVTQLATASEDMVEKMQRVFYYESDDSVSGQLRSSFRTLRRRAETALSDDNHKAIAALIATNVAVWGLWRVSFRYPKMERFMWRHFACSYDAVVRGKRLHTLFTSAFSHITVPHIAINMFMLWEFGSHIIAPKDSMDSWLDNALSRSRVVDFIRSSMAAATAPQLLPLDKFLTLYGSSALASSVLSIIASRFRGTPGVFTIGASGAVMGVLTAYCLMFPERRMMLYGMFDLTAAQMLQLMTAMNLIGSAFQRNLHIDFTGHLGGQVTGLALHEGRPELA